MSIKFTKRAAAGLLGRGESSIRIDHSSLQEAEKAITREDVRDLISKGKVYALPAKHNISVYSKVLQKKRLQGRRRGVGRKRGGRNARASLEYKEKVRAQRRVLHILKEEKLIDNTMFKGFYRLVRGGTFQSKASLLSHITSTGIKVSEEKLKQLKHA